ncbi:MAG: sulfatase-like hydrolase/transferase [Acidimicrobiaceae bacterium]|nr:sulfatase-like hydrolase/transferase [Acidimicrobiaceae bacterium]
MPRDLPNVLVVLLDQLRYDVVADPARCDTPHLDRLCGEGALFEQHYTPTGLCSPARASLMTGLYPHTHGVVNNVHGRTAVLRDLPDGDRTVGEFLTDAGYRTGYVGKWHLGMTKGATERGFAEVRFPEGEHEPSVAVGLEDYRDAMVFTRPRHDRGQRFPLYLSDPVPQSLVPANLAFDGALDLLESYASGTQPFFLLVSFPEPHHPTILPEEFVDRYDPASLEPWPSFGDSFEGKPRTNEALLRHFGVAEFTWEDWAPVVARYLATVTMLDALIGRMMDELERRGWADHTMVLVTTDHGDMTGNHRQFNKGPVMYEDVYHIPLLIRTPDAQQRRVGALTTHLDLLPTIAEFTGIKLPPRSWAGQSLMPWLRGEDPGWRSSLLCEYHGDEFGLYSQRMVRRGSHKLVYNPNDVSELYDLAVDPHELHNLAGHPECSTMQRELEQELLAMMRETGDGLAEFAGMMLG